MIDNTHQDDLFKPGYDMSEAGFLRRNKAWTGLSDKFKDKIRTAAANHQELIVDKRRQFHVAKEAM